MKGPSGRLRHDVRRVWQCPACGSEERTGGAVVNLACPCGERCDPPRRVWMRLRDEPRRRARDKPAPDPAPRGDGGELPGFLLANGFD
ncbi:MAG TPA: hypothetical protein VEL76_27610 [Gemmataceae bacterium]|nr:hypothetical protein [Gemmataceae bacterium]